MNLKKTKTFLTSDYKTFNKWPKYIFFVCYYMFRNIYNNMIQYWLKTRGVIGMYIGNTLCI